MAADILAAALGLYWVSYVTLRVIFPHWYPVIFIPLDFLFEDLWR